jgi:2-methylcitrate dehydratase PrpD
MPLASSDPAFAVSAAMAGIRFEHLPVLTVASVKRLVVDSIAVALAGRGCKDTDVLFTLASEWGGRAECAILGSSLRVPAPIAALVNGTMIQALDFDDTHDPSSTHTASTVLAAALAIAESRRSSGKELLAAVAIGVDLAARLGRASAENIGWTSTAVYGAFGAAAAAAHVLRLTAEETRHALGIVLSQAAGTSQTAFDGPLSKHMQSGFAAKAGVLSALLAARGVTGVENVFEGKFGFFNLYKGGRYRIEPLLADWGRRFEVHALSLKPYPSCRATHAPIEAALALVEQGIQAAQVSSVRVAVPRIACDLAGQPFAEGGDPTISAQFSIPYTVATAFVHRDVRLRHFRVEAIRDREVRSLLEHVSIAVEPGSDFLPARVEVTMRDGQIRSHTVTTLKGSPDNPLTAAELLAKIEDCLAFAPAGCTALDAPGLQRLIENVETMGDVSDLVPSLIPAARSRPQSLAVT